MQKGGGRGLCGGRSAGAACAWGAGQGGERDAGDAQDLAGVGDGLVGVECRWSLFMLAPVQTRRSRSAPRHRPCRRRNASAVAVLKADVRASRSSAPGRRLALLAILFATATFAHAPLSALGATGGAGEPGLAPKPAATPFDRQGMWIWYVDSSEGGSAARILSRAERNGIGTVYIKAGDGGSIWSQFSPELVRALHRGGLDVCAWQYVYGTNPLAEARVGAAAVANGADCLVIDAESSYEGRYAAAETYIRALRARIGPNFPLSLASFPYVDYHPAFPYSVFFGPGGATYNQPQMYWKAIGTSVRAVYAHTYLFNRLWGHPIYPMGQTYESPGRGEIVRFRSFARSYGGLEPSWWDWQETSSAAWGALRSSAAGPVAGFRPANSQPVLMLGSRGDLVVWAQEHLQAAGLSGFAVSGIFGRSTAAAVRSFQSAHDLSSDGVIGAATWSALLEFSPVAMRWSRGAAGSSAHEATAGRASAPDRPRSASLPPKADEIPLPPRP